MARELSAGMQAEVSAAFKRPIVLYEGAFQGGVLRLWSGFGEISWNGETWSGAGNLIGVSEITETAGITAQGATIQLSGMPSSLIAQVELNARHGLRGTVYLGFMDAAGALVTNPYPIFSGKLDVPEITDTGQDCSISISYESHLVRLQNPIIRRWTHEDQQIEHPGDRGFEYVASNVTQVIDW